MYRTMTLLILCTLCSLSLKASADSIFSYAEINIPFEVKVDGSWVQVIESQEEWQSFYSAYAIRIGESDSETETAPDIDFNHYTIIAGGLGAGSAARSLMIERVGDSDTTTYVSALVLQRVGCVVLAVATFPTIVILVPKPKNDLQFFLREATIDCGDLG